MTDFNENDGQGQPGCLPSTYNTDAFDGYTNDVEGQQHRTRLIRGALLKFSNDGQWTLRDNVPFDTAKELLVEHIERALQKWDLKTKTPIDGELIRVPPGKAWPNLEEMNSACPKEEWGTDLNDRPKGPWQQQTFIYLIDVSKDGMMDEYTLALGTIGGNIAIETLADKTKRMRDWNRKNGGSGNVVPVVKLSSTPMRTRFSAQPRPRPHFVPQRFVEYSAGDDAGTPALPRPTKPPSLPSGAAVSPGGHVVSEPSARQELDDDIPF